MECVAPIKHGAVDGRILQVAHHRGGECGIHQALVVGQHGGAVVGADIPFRQMAFGACRPRASKKARISLGDDHRIISIARITREPVPGIEIQRHMLFRDEVEKPSRYGPGS